MSTKRPPVNMYCPNCGRNRNCKKIDPRLLGYKPHDGSNQNWYAPGQTDITYYQRGRECTHCEHKFITAETEVKFVFELGRCRDEKAELRLEVESLNLDVKTMRNAYGMLRAENESLVAENNSLRKRMASAMEHLSENPPTPLLLAS